MSPSLEQHARLYVGGLVTGVTAEELKGRFSKLPGVVTVKSVDMKQAGILEQSFAFVDLVVADEDKLKKAIRMYDKSSWKGNKLRVELSKPDYLARLKNEWKQNEERAANEAAQEKLRQEALLKEQQEYLELNAMDKKLRIKKPRKKGSVKVVLDRTNSPNQPGTTAQSQEHRLTRFDDVPLKPINECYGSGFVPRPKPRVRADEQPACESARVDESDSDSTSDASSAVGSEDDESVRDQADDESVRDQADDESEQEEGGSESEQEEIASESEQEEIATESVQENRASESGQEESASESEQEESADESVQDETDDVKAGTDDVSAEDEPMEVDGDGETADSANDSPSVQDSEETSTNEDQHASESDPEVEAESDADKGTTKEDASLDNFNLSESEAHKAPPNANDIPTTNNPEPTPNHTTEENPTARKPDYDQYEDESFNVGRQSRTTTEFDTVTEQLEDDKWEQSTAMKPTVYERMRMSTDDELHKESESALSILDKMLGEDGAGGNGRPKKASYALAQWASVQKYDPSSSDAHQFEVSEDTISKPSFSETRQGAETKQQGGAQAATEDTDTKAADDETSPAQSAPQESASGFSFNFFGGGDAKSGEDQATDGDANLVLENGKTKLRSVFEASMHKKEEEKPFKLDFFASSGDGEDAAGGDASTDPQETEMAEQQEAQPFAEVVSKLLGHWNNTWTQCPGMMFRRRETDDKAGSNLVDSRSDWLRTRYDLTQDFKRKRKFAIKQGLGGKKAKQHHQRAAPQSV